MISWDLITQIDTVIDSVALGACGSQLKAGQPILHAWIGRRQREFNRAEWVLFCRTALVIWKALEEQRGPLPAITKDDLQTVGAQVPQRLSHLVGTWPEEHLASAILSWIGDYGETDLVMFCGFKYQQALSSNVPKEVRPKKGVEFLQKAWIMIDAISLAIERSQEKDRAEISTEQLGAGAESSSIIHAELEEGQT